MYKKNPIGMRFLKLFLYGFANAKKIKKNPIPL